MYSLALDSSKLLQASLLVFFFCSAPLIIYDIVYEFSFHIEAPLYIIIIRSRANNEYKGAFESCRVVFSAKQI